MTYQAKTTGLSFGSIEVGLIHHPTGAIVDALGNPITDANPMPIEIVTPIELNGAVPVNLQDQTTPAVIVPFNQITNSTTLSVEAVMFEYTITVADATGIVAGSYIVLFNPVSVRFSQFICVSVLASVVTLDSQIDFAYPVGTFVDIGITELSVDGSVTPQVFGLRGTGIPPGIGLTADITRLIFSCVADSAIDLSLFVNIARLSRGLLIRKRDDVTINVFNVKDNGELAGIMFDWNPFQATNPAQGVDGFVARLTFAGQNKIGVVQRLAVGEDLEAVIQDDLTGITSLKILAEGHIVTDVR